MMVVNAYHMRNLPGRKSDVADAEWISTLFRHGLLEPTPRNDESAGKIKSRKITKGNPYIKSILCQVAWAAVRCRYSYFADWFWSHQGKLGRRKTIIAVARKILVLIYKLLKSGEFYDPMVASSQINR